MDFLFFYEHENREFESLLLIKRILQWRGYCVGISHVSARGYGWHTLFSAPKVVIVPWFRYDDNVYKYTRFLRKKVNKIVNLQMEQIYSNYGVDTGLVTTQGLAKEGYHLCWGEHSKERMLSRGIQDSHTHICGAVQLDFFHPAFAGYFKSRLELAGEYNLDESKQWRMFISSFAYATYTKETLQHLKDNFGDYSEFAHVSRISREKILNWYEKVLPVRKDVLFIYRPHPSETADERLLGIERRFGNFKVISNYSIRHWIVACNVIDTWYSTSIAEVYFAKKNCHILRPEPIPNKYEVEIMANAQFINTYSDFIKTFDNNALSEKPFPIPEEHLKLYYEQCNECLSAERICDYLEKVLHNDSYSADYYLGLIGNKKKYYRVVITSLLGDIIYHLGVRLSRIIPIRKDILRNLEDKNIGRRKKLQEMEKTLSPYIDNYLNTKNIISK